MSEKYKEIMEYVNVDEDMYNRIINNIQSVNPSPRKNILRLPHIKQIVSVAACLILLATAFALTPKIIHQKPQPTQQPDCLDSQGIESCKTINELSKKVGFSVSNVKSLAFTPSDTEYTSYFGNIAEIKYKNETQTAVFRKSKDKTDNSGDYNSYSSIKNIKSGCSDITLKGNGKKYLLAIWHNGKYSYSLSLSTPISQKQWEKIINDIE